MITTDNSHKPKGTSITIRPVKPGQADLDAIVTIVIEAFPHDPQWPWRYPYRGDCQEDHYKFTRLYYAEYMDMAFAGRKSIMLAEAPSLEDPHVRKVIAMSVWDNYGDASPNPGLPVTSAPKNYPERRDACPRRLAKYSECSQRARKELFVSRYGEKMLSLRQLATLPAYWRMGAATMLCKWGMEKARKADVAVPIFASPMGKLLYESLGFRQVGTWKAQVEGEDEALVIHALTWEPAWERQAEEALVLRVD